MSGAADRILTTHVGSLPRSRAVAELLLTKERGEPYGIDVFDRTIAEAVMHVVERQVRIGIDIVSDGETSKISYATYIKDRLSGFSGDRPRQVALDLKDFPDFRAKMAAFAGAQSFKRACCTGPVAAADREPLLKDLANLRAAVNAHRPHGAFLNAASPGVVSAFQPNEHYPNHEAYVEAIAEAMREEYEAIVAAGFQLQLDCPDLAMARHTGFQDLDEEEFLKRAALQVEALNHAVRNIPAAALRMHVCWGNYEGPHHFDIPLAKILAIVLKAKPTVVLFEAANPRHAHEWTVWRDTRLPDDKILVPGVIASTSNYVEHPEWIAQRLGQFADIVGRERVLAGTDCGFGTFAGIGKVDPEIAYLKLGALVEGAALASTRLWNRRAMRS
jgi:5-methyltetrahydropteroyltriglutamate--homocysteine methyltransferase